MKRGRPLQSVQGLALRVHRVLRESGPRPLTVLRGLCEQGTREVGLRADAEIVFERVIGILFLRGIVEWVGGKSGRKIAARTR